MPATASIPLAPVQDDLRAAAPEARRLPCFAGDDFLAVDGGNAGDPLCPAQDMILGDVYALAPGARPRSLPVRAGIVTEGRGRPGGCAGWLALDCCATLIAADGGVLEILVLVGGRAGDGAQVHLHALGDIVPRRPYTLVAVDREAAEPRFAEAACASFTAGTRVALASGAQVPVEGLRPGERILTRDHGPQPLRWIGHRTVRATGAFAPIRIAAGALNNTADLLVSPAHRLFVYQRHDHLRAGRAEILVPARHLLDGRSVTRTSGGFVDYYQMLFDRHEIIYAEGIAAETLILDDTTRAALPEGMRPTAPGSLARVLELPEGHLERGGAADLLRRASHG